MKSVSILQAEKVVWLSNSLKTEYTKNKGLIRLCECFRFSNIELYLYVILYNLFNGGLSQFTMLLTPRLYTHFTQFDWLMETFYTSIKSRARNHLIYFLSASKKTAIFDNICNIFGIQRNELIFLWILSMCKLRQTTHIFVDFHDV